jgi:ribosomal subunit interface protein
MKVTVTARHAKFNAALKEMARSKAEHLEHFFDHLTKLEVILDAENGRRYTCEMIAHAVRGNVLVCHAADGSPGAAVESAANRMERHLTKFKERLIGRHHGARESRRGADTPDRNAAADIWW